MGFGSGQGEGFHSRRIPIDPSCRRCGDIKEKLDYILLNCHFARAIGYIWRARNDHVFGTKVWSPQEVILVAESAFQEFQKASGKGLQHSVGTTTIPPQSSLDSHWFPPPTGFVKVYCDAALKQGSSEGGIGLVFPTDVGTTLHALSAPLHFTTTLQGEALAIKMAISKAINLGIFNPIVEYDCKGAVHYLEGILRRPPLEEVVVLDDAKRLCNSFNSVLSSFILRNLNVVADTLARTQEGSVYHIYDRLAHFHFLAPRFVWSSRPLT
ncbi:uncharacterized protein LOC122662829 [Telopea speciosissima]|uniref:uncharacterized protein LOC122662829 n=1 Tax=Telopea speciosissima TaxID=54955 RepID=UPI001CC6CD9B|nr:uncharacterized protein LOC122662829 [Telopea speciosissima]